MAELESGPRQAASRLSFLPLKIELLIKARVSVVALLFSEDGTSVIRGIKNPMNIVCFPW